MSQAFADFYYATSKSVPVVCAHPECKRLVLEVEPRTETYQWRHCANCSKRIAFCTDHGGHKKATEEIRAHGQAEHGWREPRDNEHNNNPSGYKGKGAASHPWGAKK